MPFALPAISAIAKKAMASKLGQGVAKTLKPGQAAEGLAPEEFQTAVPDGAPVDTAVEGLPDKEPSLTPREKKARRLGDMADTFSSARQESQARLDAMPTPEEIAAQGPISRILSNYGG